MTCPYCGHTVAIEQSAGRIAEYDLAEGLRLAKRIRAAELVEGGFEIQCSGCGSRAIVDKQADHCAFCGSPRVSRCEDETETLLPESLLPFAIDRRAATTSFRAWVASLWLAPNDLRQRARQQGMDGVYLPFWSYDSKTHTRYTGKRGVYYTVSESYTDSNGRRGTRQVRKIRWTPASGSVDVRFEDVLICASGSLPQELVNRLEPWDVQALVGYRPHYLSGFSAERYSIDLERGFQLAEQRMIPRIDTAIERDIGGDVQSISGRQVSHSQTRFMHFLLPLWISSFRYKEKSYRVIVNARTGETTGERPWSTPKIAFLVLTLLAIVAAVFYAAHRYG